MDFIVSIELGLSAIAQSGGPILFYLVSRL